MGRDGSYTEKDIESLEDLEHIRKRPGMYIGALGDGTDRWDGLYVLVQEVVDNSVDEFIMKFGNTIDVECTEKSVRIRDYGRGIPQKSLIDCVSKTNTGGKFNQNVFQCSSGLNGVGLKAVNAVSSYFEARSYRDGKCFSCVFEKGVFKEKKSRKIPEGETGTEILFTPDDSKGLFENYSYNLDIIYDILCDYSYLSPGLTINFNGKKIKSRNGLKDLLVNKIGDADILYDIAHYTNKEGDISIAFTHMPQSFSEEYFSFANGKYTIHGGTHLSSFKEGLSKGLNDFFRKDWDPKDTREGLIAAISVRVQDPFFDGQTKTKCICTEIKTKVVDFVKECTVDYFLKNQKAAQALKEKIIQAEKMHKDISEIKKTAKTLQSKTKLNIPKLKDCRYHLNDRNKKDREKGENSMIFICEGDSAAGSFIPTRNVENQAVFPVRGKISNVEKKNNKKVIYGNEELFNLVSALGIENDMDNLRYGKVIIATDADYDGYHIRLLLMTFFINFFPELINDNRVYILETPLFKVRNKTMIEYCYNERERDKAIERVKNAEITRFKGLGEVNPSDFKSFIAPESIVLIPVKIDSVGQVDRMVEFYMGGNTPERRDFIMDNLLDDVN